MRSIIAISIAALLAAGCANTDYKMYSETQQKIAQAYAVAETARYNALAEIAKNGDSAAKVAAVLSLQMGNGGNQRREQQVAPPTTLGDTALKWTSVLLPSFTQFYTVQRNTAVSMRQSDNQAAIAISTNKAFSDISAAGHTANKDIATSGFNAINQSNTAGFNALGTQSTAAFNSLQGVGVAGFNALKDTAGLIQAPAPNITVTGNYNSGDNSGNSGKISAGSLTDNTATPTVVMQPDPVVTKDITTTTTTTTTSSSVNTGGGN